MRENLAAEEIVACVRRLYRGLAAAPTLEPAEETNALFSELVEVCLSAGEKTAARVLGDPEVARIRPHLTNLCARGEYLLERSWSDRISGGEDPGRELSLFPYSGNYERLTRMEVHALRGAVCRPVRRALFIGSGPLPMTALPLARDHGFAVDCVDREAEPCEMGAELAARLGLARTPRFTHRDALELESLNEYDAVFLAALVGMEERDKERLVRHIGELMRPGALLALRTAHQLKRLLYPETDPASLGGFEPQVIVQPLNDVIDSVIIARKAADAGERVAA